MSVQGTNNPPYPEQKQPGSSPGDEHKMDPKPDYGLDHYVGSGKLKGKVALVTGADSGIGRAIALAYAREGAEAVAIGYWNEHEDAKQIGKDVEEAGSKALLLPGDLAEEQTVKEYVEKTVNEFGRIDILVNNASQQEDLTDWKEIPRERLERTFKVNILAMFSLAQKAVRHMGKGGSIINVASIQAYQPTPGILDYACTKGSIVTMTKGLGMALAKEGIRVNAIAPGPVWTPLVISSFPPEQTKNFGADMVPMGRCGQPWEYMGPAVFLASEHDSSYVTSAVIPVTGGAPTA
jgi:hypothetical protein